MNRAVPSSLLSVLLFAAISLAAQAADVSPSVFESPEPPSAKGEIDRLVFARLEKLKIKPVLCSDAVFVRRAYLDLIGRIPTAEEARRFITDSTPDKRDRLIDQLLEREEFADYWAMRWGDILRIKAEFPVNLWPNAAQAYHRWVRTSIAENKPYDRFVRELLTSSGSNFRVPPVNFYRAIQNRTPEGIAAAVALAFMGARTDSWPAEKMQNMTVFFSQVGYKPTREWKEEHVIWDPYGITKQIPKPNQDTGETAPAGPIEPKRALEKPIAVVFPDGTKGELRPDQDPREVFADWLIRKDNPWFARAAVNRIWFWLLGRGIIHEPDDIRDDNPPSNPELLAYLEKQFVASGYDTKKLFRQILTSTSYQLTSEARVDTPEARAQFAYYPLRRLDAEVLIDAINFITGSDDLYTSPIPEPFTYIPKGVPAVAIADGSITSPFLALFGRSARATGMLNERDNKPVPAQALHMLNSSHIQRKIEQGPKLTAIFTSDRQPAEILEEIYLAVLSRFPTPEEVKTAAEYRAAGTARRSSRSRPREEWIDITWALINSPEFMYRH